MGNGGAEQRELGLQLAVGARQNEYDDVDGNEDLGGERAGGCIPPAQALAGRGTAGADALKAVRTDGGVVQTVGARRTSAARARPAGGSIRVMETGGDGVDASTVRGAQRYVASNT